MGPQEEFDYGLSNVIGLVDGVCEKFSQVRTCPPLPHRLAPAKAKALTPPPFRACVPRSRALANQNGPVLETASGARPYKACWPGVWLPLTAALAQGFPASSEPPNGFCECSNGRLGL